MHKILATHKAKPKSKAKKAAARKTEAQKPEVAKPIEPQAANAPAKPATPIPQPAAKKASIFK